MRLRIPNSDVWSRHLNHRFQEAKEITLAEESTCLNAVNASIYLPDGFNYVDLGKANPTASLRDYLSIAVKEDGWIARLDCFDQVSHYLKLNFESDSIFLVCEAGYSKIGDKSLERKEHITFSGKALLTKQIERSEEQEITQTLRWSRSSRVLAVLTTLSKDIGYQPARSGVFICDAFDGDTLITVEFKTP